MTILGTSFYPPTCIRNICRGKAISYLRIRNSNHFVSSVFESIGNLLNRWKDNSEFDLAKTYG